MFTCSSWRFHLGVLSKKYLQTLCFAPLQRLGISLCSLCGSEIMMNRAIKSKVRFSKLVVLLLLTLPPVLEIGAAAQTTQDERISDLIRDLGLPNIGNENFEKIVRARQELADIGYQAVPQLIESLRSENSGARARASQALGLIKPPIKAAVPALIPLLTDSDDGVVLEAAITLGVIGKLPDNAAEPLIQALKHSDSNVRLNAAYALGMVINPSQPIVDALVLALRDSSSHVRNNAAFALGRFCSKSNSAVPALRKALNDTDAHVRAMAAASIKQITCAKP
ncbi:HEAT repeat domain-containing protein [Gloeobacter morelensis]|uniref:HEAT repeat domain-containing protein n=1 Tax=Gloeobacter morelensis MG652769 TaxID=2781736 RepID=A0ABY3PRD3_9CYAN|nr:HEAT repeat domain-containing protein [Gloeobacter morelensis]UFP96241.1 HEAT repeat domain-containing protein [Gloeobacter morelensis MG652769]